jgi:hypothetical protein
MRKITYIKPEKIRLNNQGAAGISLGANPRVA